jgi:hypothetical protein
MSSQSTNSRPSRTASSHAPGYYSQIADGVAEGVAAVSAAVATDKARGRSKSRSVSNPTSSAPESLVCKFGTNGASLLTLTNADSPNDVTKEHGERPNFSEIDGKKRRFAFHAWEVAWRDEMTAKWGEAATKQQRNVDIGALQHKINQSRLINGEQLVAIEQITNSIRNTKAENKNQDFELLAVNLPSAHVLANETATQLLRYVD